MSAVSPGLVSRGPCPQEMELSTAITSGGTPTARDTNSGVSVSTLASDRRPS